MNKRIIEETIEVLDVATSASASTAAIDLNWAEKFSIQVLATSGASVAHLEASNNKSNWTEIDNFSLAEGASNMFEQPDSDYRWARITIENNDVAPVSADCFVLVIGDGE